MANTKSAIKRIRKIATQTLVNKARKSKYRNAIKIEENSCDERLNKESEDFAAMWYTAFPEQLDDPIYLSQQQLKSIKTIIHEKKN